MLKRGNDREYEKIAQRKKGLGTVEDRPREERWKGGEERSKKEVV